MSSRKRQKQQPAKIVMEAPNIPEDRTLNDSRDLLHSHLGNKNKYGIHFHYGEFGF